MANKTKKQKIRSELVNILDELSELEREIARTYHYKDSPPLLDWFHKLNKQSSELNNIIITEFD